MADKIQVAVRVRPILSHGKSVKIHWKCEQGGVMQINPHLGKPIGNPYFFDEVFGTEARNHDIFSRLVQPLIDSAMKGFNITVMAYGQTASGKTYTMMGCPRELGVVQLAVAHIFNTIEQNPERAFLLRCSYVEIYNETISDLLSACPSTKKLKVQDVEGQVVIKNLVETNVKTPDAVLELMEQGNRQRKIGDTAMNERSSRSHAIFRIIVESALRDEPDAAVMVSHINLVDLAGSERASQTHATGDRFREGCAINTSLSALSLVIKQLSEGEGFVNFRDSKLTHILRASLGGNARTAIICNVTPTVLEETSSTLKFASNAKVVQNKPLVNKIVTDQAQLRQCNNYIKDLEKRLKEKECEKSMEAIEEMQRLLQEKDIKIRELKERLVVSSSEATAFDERMSSAQRSFRRMTWGGNRLKGLTLPIDASPPVGNSPLFKLDRPSRLINFSNSDMVIDDLTTPDWIDSAETFFPAEYVFQTPDCLFDTAEVGTMTDVPFPSSEDWEYRETNEELRRQLREKSLKIEELQNQVADTQSFTNRDQHEIMIAENEAKIQELNQENERLQSVIQLSFKQLDDKVFHLNRFQSSLEEAQVQIKELLRTRLGVLRELSESRQKISDLERELQARTEVRGVFERYSIALEAAKAEMLALEERKQQAGINHRALEEIIEAKDQQIAALQEQRFGELEQSSFDQKRLQEQIDQLSGQIDSLEAMVEARDRQIVALQEADASGSIRRHQALDVEADRPARSDQETAECSQLREELGKTLRQLEETSARCRELESDRRRLVCELCEAKAWAEKVSEQLGKEAAIVMSADQSREEVDAKTWTEELCSEVVCLNEKLDNKTLETLRLQAELEEARVETKRLASISEIARAEADEALAKMRDLKEAARFERQGRAEAQESMEKLARLETDAVMARQQLECQLQVALQHVSEVTTELEQSSCALKAVRAQNAILKQEAALATNKTVCLESSLREYEAKMTDLSRHIHEKTQKVLQLEDELSRQTSSQQGQLEELQRREEWLRERMRELDEVRKLLESLQMHNTHLESFKRDLMSQNISLSLLVDKLRQDLEVQEQHSREELKTFEATTEKVAVLECRLAERDAEMAQLSRHADEKAEHVRRLENELNRTVTNYSEEISRLKGELMAQKEEMATLQSSVVNAQNQTAVVEVCLANLRFKYDTVKASLSETINKLRAELLKIKAIASENESLKKEVQETRSAKEALHSHSASAQEEQTRQTDQHRNTTCKKHIFKASFAVRAFVQDHQSEEENELHAPDKAPNVRKSANLLAPSAHAQSYQRWPGPQAECITKDEIEKINNCNPS